MLGIEVIRILSIVFLVGLVVAMFMLVSFGRKRRDLGSVKASRQSYFVLLFHVWHLLIFPIPLILLLVGVVMPNWVYGTILNLSFQGAEYLQVFSLPLLLVSVVLCGWSARVLGEFMNTHIQVVQKHKLVTRGPYSRIRHPAYTSAIVFALASALLYLNLIWFIVFLAMFAIAYKRAVLEEELLASEDGFGQDYRNYMKKTGRFLPRL
jgi:protein-S-isoprenylcysteine O-methyltransferase Ste14